MKKAEIFAVLVLLSFAYIFLELSGRWHYYGWSIILPYLNLTLNLPQTVLIGGLIAMIIWELRTKRTRRNEA